MTERLGEYTYWLHVISHQPGHTVVEAEPGYKPCKRPGEHRVWMAEHGPICPGCDRVCRIPIKAGLTKGDKIVVIRQPAKTGKGKTR